MWTERKEYSNPDVILVFFAGCLAYHLKWGEGLVLPRMLCTDNSTLSTNFPVCRIGVWLRSYASIWLYAYQPCAHMIICSSHIYLIWPSHLIRIHLKGAWVVVGFWLGFLSSLIFFVSFLYFFDFKHLKQSNELSLELDWFFLIIYMYNILIH